MTDKSYPNPTTFTERNIGSMRLLRRSKDYGDGWRQVSDQLWPLTENMPDEP